MMIPILTDYYKEGYLSSPKYDTLVAFFPNCNLSLRKEVFRDIGLYDEERNAGEDADICYRAASGGWELFYEPRANCRHEAKKSLKGLLKQWLFYGYHSASLFKKIQKESCEIFVSLDFRPKVNDYFRLLKISKFPFRVLIFLSYFSVIHILTFLLAFSLFAGFNTLTHFLGAILAVFAITLYFSAPMKRFNFRQRLLYLFITYMINISCIVSSLIGGLKNRMLYIYPGL